MSSGAARSTAAARRPPLYARRPPLAAAAAAARRRRKQKPRTGGVRGLADCRLTVGLEIGVRLGLFVGDQTARVYWTCSTKALAAMETS